MKTFRFMDFNVYQIAKQFQAAIYKLSIVFPRDYFALGDQIRRSSLSVVLNIAEGSAKNSDRDFHRYLINALGSINETVAGLDIALDQKLISLTDFERLENQADSIAKQLGGLAKKLKS